MTTAFTHTTTTTSTLDRDGADHVDAAQPLRRTLRLNAATSVAGGLVAAIAADRINDLLGAESPGAVRLVGLGLVLFAVDVIAVSTMRTRRLTAIAPWISAVDFLWVAASVAAMALGWFSAGGAAIVGAVAAVVAVFGITQLVLSRRLRA